MRYQQPFGIADPNAPYVNGDPSIARQGSIPPASAFEYPMRELVGGVIEKSMLAPTDTDLLQVAKGVRSQRMNFADDTGSANNLSCSFDPPLGQYTLGLIVRAQIQTTNTGASTIDAGAGRVPIKLMNGAATGPGDLPAGGVAELCYDGSAFQLVNSLGLGGGTGTGNNYLIKIPYAVDTSPTPNIVTVSFTPAITTLAAGDPLLVKINNTCTGPSVLRINALSDKPIVANGGPAMLQGDMQKNDVMLFLYDGTQFWVQPNPLISADTTLNVPSQYSTVENALLAIRRKTIAQNALVDILIGISNIPPFKINHANADRIRIRGTMKIAGNVPASLFARTGNSTASRAADSANNIAMLRTRFGTEVQVPANAGFTAGIENVGPGNPTVQDILVTGQNYWSGDGVGRWVGVTVLGGRYLNCVNVSAWGLDIGYYGGGFMSLLNCFSSAAFRSGALATSLANFSFNGCGMFGGALNGLTCNQNSCIGTTATFTQFNANIGASATDNAELTFLGSTSTGNGNVDLAAGPISFLIVLNNGGFDTSSPAPGYLSNVGAFISVN